MYQYLKHNKINKTWWDDCVYQSENGIVFSLSAYLDCVAPGWDGIVLQDTNGYKAVMPVPLFKKFGLFPFVKQPVYSYYYSLATSPGIQEDYAVALSLFQKHVKVTASYALFQAPVLVPFAFNTGVNVNTEVMCALELNKPYEALKKVYSASTKSRIRKASKYTAEVSDDINILTDLFRNYTSQKIYHVDAAVYPVLEKLYNALSAQKLASLYIARNTTGKAQAAALFVIFKKQVYYLVASQSDEGRKNTAGYMLIDHFLQQPQYIGYTLYLGGGADLPQINSFYQKFGATYIPYQVMSFNQLPGPLKGLQTIRRKVYQMLINNKART
jgi:lipid II:glycine glycyltransferase (peptidoglycan interpeptide bridge formation enzyme)